MKVLVFEKGAEADVLSRVRAQAHAAARRATHVGSNVAHLVPATWDGQGRPPPGYTIPMGTENEPDDGRVAIVVEDDFARNKTDFVGALDALPVDWKRDVVATKEDSVGVKVAASGGTK